MTFGKTVNNGNVRYSRSYYGDNTTAIAKSSQAESATPTESAAPVAQVTVKAELSENGTYTLTVTALGQSTTVRDVHRNDLEERIARLITVVSKAYVAGELAKSKPIDVGLAGMSVPRPNKANLRFS